MDKLSIVNLKLWHVQDWVHGVESEEDIERSEAFQNIKKLKDLNLQRNVLVEEIDELLERSVRTQSVPMWKANKCITDSSKKTGK